jgi:hypothetical protein
LASKTVLDAEAESTVKVIKFYSYDVWVNNFPKGVVRGEVMPEDTDGSMDNSFELEVAVLPRIYVLPARNKGMPFRAYFGDATAGAIIDFIIKHTEHELKIAKKSRINLGKSTKDDQAFYAKLQDDGISIQNPTRLFTNGGFELQDKADAEIDKPRKKKETKEP